MAIQPISKGFSINRFDGNGVETVWEFSFEGGYLNREYVKCFLYNPITREEIPAVFTWINAYSVQVLPAVPIGTQLIIKRDTMKVSPLVDFRAGALRTPENLSKDFTQALNVATEAMDAANGSSYLAEYAADTSEAALGIAKEARETANSAVVTAGTAVGIANGALQNSAAAIATANDAHALATDSKILAEGLDGKITAAVSTAQGAVTTADAATITANTAVVIAEQAGSVAMGIDAKATAAVNAASLAEVAAHQALDTANAIDAKATDALNTANTANTTAWQASATANAVDAKATAAQSSADAAARVAQEAATAAAASAAAVAGKADKSYVDTGLATKADKSYVDAELAIRPDKTYLTNSLAGKASITDLAVGLATKADKTYVDSSFVQTAAPDLRRHLGVFHGAAGAQIALQYNGYGDNILRVAQVLEPDASYSFYAYSNTEAYIRQMFTLHPNGNAELNGSRVLTDANAGLDAKANVTVVSGYWNRTVKGDEDNAFTNLNLKGVSYEGSGTRYGPIVRSIVPDEVQSSGRSEMFLRSRTIVGHALASYASVAGELCISDGGARQVVYSFQGDGVAVAGSDWVAPSDIRKKTNIKARCLSLDAILTLPLVTWDWKSGAGTSSGTIAQEVQKLMPELINEDAEGFLAMSDGKVALNIALSLAQEVKALREEVCRLMARR